MTKVLLLEDDEWFADSILRQLEMARFEVSVSKNVDDAILKIDDFLPDVIVADMLLTGTNLMVFLHEIRSYEDLAKIPVIICSSLAGDLSVSDLKSYGVKKIIDKLTMHPEDVVLAIKGIL